MRCFETQPFRLALGQLQMLWHWVMLRNSIHYLLHYLDDLGRPDSPERLNALSLALNTCETLDVTVAQNKTESPLTFLGITIDMAINQLRLPPEKLKHSNPVIAIHLHHAASVVPAGRSFVCRMIETSKKATKPHHFKTGASDLVGCLPATLKWGEREGLQHIGDV